MKTLFAAAVAVSMLTGTVTTAYADNDRDRGRHYERDRHDDRGKDRRDYRGHDRRDHDRRDYDRRDHRRDYDRYHDSRWDRRDAYRAGYAHGRYDRGRYVAPRGYYVRHWRHGDHLPRSYYDTRYVVRDYHVYHLSPPPRGHHWIRVNDDVVLAAIASGLVVSVVNGLFY